ncbi:DUF6166 domain-containing protein [Octadecabacter sp.]|nr:DUF6166 domain-containing protein [Octadecabacter sp.]
MSVKTYAGDRTIDGCMATVDGQPLDPAYSVKLISDDGYEWSYEGAGPAQLSLAILNDYFDDPNKALMNYDIFMSRVVANFNNEWEMTSDDIAAALSNIVTT